MRTSVASILAGPIILLLACPASSQAGPEVTEYFGMCDASASVAVGQNLFVVANDEDNVLRVYLHEKSGKPVKTFDVSSFLKTDPDQEADIEGATRKGGRVYWITSHGRNKDGKLRPSRHRFFATEVTIAGDQVAIATVGVPYKNLLQDLTETPELKDYKLDEASTRPPEQAGGLNIEGLSATPEGKILIGFRNPIHKRKALIVVLENPEDVVQGKPAKFGKPISLSLDGRGIRSIEYFEPWQEYLLIAGPPDDEGDFKLYRWAGPSSEEVKLIKGVNFNGLHPEALIVYPKQCMKIQVLSDDGARQVGGKDCKDKKVAMEKKSVRSIWLTLPTDR